MLKIGKCRFFPSRRSHRSPPLTTSGDVVSSYAYPACADLDGDGVRSPPGAAPGATSGRRIAGNGGPAPIGGGFHHRAERDARHNSCKQPERSPRRGVMVQDESFVSGGARGRFGTTNARRRSTSSRRRNRQLHHPRLSCSEFRRAPVGRCWDA